MSIVVIKTIAIVFCLSLLAWAEYLEHKKAKQKQQPVMETYVAFRNLDKTRIGLGLKEHYISPGYDTAGEPRLLILEFRAASREEANIRFNKFLNDELFDNGP